MDLHGIFWEGWQWANLVAIRITDVSRNW